MKPGAYDTSLAVVDPRGSTCCSVGETAEHLGRVNELIKTIKSPLMIIDAAKQDKSFSVVFSGIDCVFNIARNRTCREAKSQGAPMHN